MRPNEGLIKKLWRIFYPILLFFAIYIIVDIVVIAIITLQTGGDLESLSRDLTRLTSDYGTLLTAIDAAVTIPIMAAFMASDLKTGKNYGTRRRFGGFNPLYLFAVVLLGAAGALLFNNLIDLSGLIQFSESSLETVNSALFSNDFLIQIIGLGVIVPIAEELTFRGLTMRRMSDYIGDIPSIFFSAIIFGIVHGNLAQGVYAVVLGIVIGYVYYRFRNIFAAILLHVAANSAIIILSSIPAFSTLYVNYIYEIIITIVAAVLFILAFSLISIKVVVRERAPYVPRYRQAYPTGYGMSGQSAYNVPKDMQDTQKIPAEQIRYATNDNDENGAEVSDVPDIVTDSDGHAPDISPSGVMSATNLTAEEIIRKVSGQEIADDSADSPDDDTKADPGGSQDS